MNIGEILISALTGPLESLTASKITELLDNLKAKNPAAHKTVVTALYPIVDVQLEGIAAGTKTKVDDAVIAGLKTAIENSAKGAGIELQNLDND